jgi:cytochrome P450
MLSLLPRFILRPLAGALARLPITASYEPCAKYLVPMFEDFVSRHDSKSKDGKDDKLPPNLFASWLVSSAASRFPPTSPERTPDFMSRRTMALNFAAVHTSTLTTCDLLLDVFSGSPKASEALREEALATLETWGPTECRRARLNGMTRLDSALRESMRLWGVAPRVLRRRVMKPGGVSLPDPGNGSGSLHVAEGTMVCISGWGIHHDERVYPQPFNYEYDRFMRSTGDKAADEEGKKTAGAAAVETDSEFTAWGIGKHACPGRYFAVDFVKMIMSHILVDYEVALLPERPANIWIEYNIVPPPGTRLSVRKRKAPTA